MPARMTEESSSIPVEIILIILIFFILVYFLSGGSVSDVFSFFKKLIGFASIYLISGLKTILQ